MANPSFTLSFLKLFSAPIIWAVHFVVIYAFTGLLCARPALRQEWLGISIFAWGIGLASALAVLAIAVIHAGDWQTRMQTGDAGFMRWTASGLGLLSIIAIVWEAMPVLLVPGCS